MEILMLLLIKKFMNLSHVVIVPSLKNYLFVLSSSCLCAEV